MTLTSRFMIKLSLVYLLIGAILGMLMLLNKVFLFHPFIWALLPVHIELMIFGWMIQFILGVAYWMLPRFLEGEPRGNQNLAYLMVISINAGIWLMIGAELSFIPEIFTLFARVLEFIAVIIFVQLHWKRIVTYHHSH